MNLFTTSRLTTAILTIGMLAVANRVGLRDAISGDNKFLGIF